MGCGNTKSHASPLCQFLNLYLFAYRTKKFLSFDKMRIYQEIDLCLKNLIFCYNLTEKFWLVMRFVNAYSQQVVFFSISYLSITGV